MRYMKKNTLIKVLLVVFLSTSTTLSFGDGGGSFNYCKKKKYYDTVVVKFPYKRLTLLSVKDNGVITTLSAISQNGNFSFSAQGQLFQKPNQALDSIVEVSIQGYAFYR